MLCSLRSGGRSVRPLVTIYYQFFLLLDPRGLEPMNVGESQIHWTISTICSRANWVNWLQLHQMFKWLLQRQASCRRSWQVTVVSTRDIWWHTSPQPRSVTPLFSTICRNVARSLCNSWASCNKIIFAHIFVRFGHKFTNQSILLVTNGDTLKVLATDVIAILGTEPVKLPVLQVDGIHRWATAETRIGGRAHVPAVYTEALAGRGEICRLMSAAAGVSVNTR